MQAPRPQTETGGDVGRNRRATAYKLAVLAGILAPVLVYLLASRRDAGGLPVGPAAPPGKVQPQIVNTVIHGGFLLAPDGGLWCWRTTDSPNPSLMEDLLEPPQRIGTNTDWCRVAAGYPNGLALKMDGSLWGWRWTSAWASARSDQAYQAPIPARIGLDTDWAQVATGAGHCLALKRDGSLWAWGQNDHGQVGNGITNYQTAPSRNPPTPIRIGTDNDWMTIAAGDFSSFGLKRDGTLWGWGFVSTAASGGDHGGDYLSPRETDSAGNVMAISANDYFLLALRADNTLWICGPNASSAASAYASGGATALVQVGKAADWKEVYAGRRFFMARKRDGSWWVCGQCKRPPPGAPVSWSSAALAAPRRLPLRFESWALAPGFGDALLLGTDGSLWTLSVRPNTGGFDLGLARLKALANRALTYLPGRPRPFDEGAFRLDLRARKLWDLPPEVRAPPAGQNLR